MYIDLTTQTLFILLLLYYIHSKQHILVTNVIPKIKPVFPIDPQNIYILKKKDKT